MVDQMTDREADADLIPLLHDFRDETVLVFGGGAVGSRRAGQFGAARVIVVSPTFADRIPGDADLVRAAPAPDDVPGWLERVGPALVVAATDDEAVNDAIAAAARDARVPVNRVDRPGGDVLVPATVRDGPVVIAISTSGLSPALSGELRRRAEDVADGAAVVAQATADLRATLQDRDVADDVRRDVLRAVVGSERVWAAARRDAGAAREAAQDVAEETLASRRR